MGADRETPEDPTPPPRNLDSADRKVLTLLYQGAYRAYGLTRVPGTVRYDENGDEA